MSQDEPASKSAPVEITEGWSRSLCRAAQRPSSTCFSEHHLFQAKQPFMIAKSVCGAWRPSRGPCFRPPAMARAQTRLPYTSLILLWLLILLAYG